MLYRKIIVVCSEIHAKHIKALQTEYGSFEYEGWWYIK
jgi:hypothetical protein